MVKINRKLKTEIAVFLVILAVASFFRLYKITSIPPGLYPDEAMNGNNAVEALETGQFRVFYPENNGREGLFINIQALSIKIFGPHPWSLRIVSVFFGIFTVVGLYLLTKEFFGWEIAGLASFLMAISSWHVNFSRIGFRAIALPFILVYGFYFFWKGLKQSNIFYFSLAGFLAGLGFYTYISYRTTPLIIIVLLVNYWLSIKKDFSISKYNYAKSRLVFGLTIFLIATILVAMPILIYYLINPAEFLSRAGASLSVFSREQPYKELFLSTVKTLGMFNFVGDHNWRHNISGWPELSLPIGIFFVIGFLRELIHWLKRKHGHFSTVHTFLFAWFFVMLLPGFISTEAPHALRAIGVIPVVMIFSAQGFYWLFEKLYRWHSFVDPHADIRESRALVVMVLLVSMISLGFWEYHRYFKVWAESSETSSAFNENYLDLGLKLNNFPPDFKEVKKYILVNAGGVLVNGIPMPSQTVMFITDTFTPEKQSAKQIFYLTEEDYRNGRYDRNSMIIPLEGNDIKF